MARAQRVETLPDLWVVAAEVLLHEAGHAHVVATVLAVTNRHVEGAPLPVRAAAAAPSSARDALVRVGEAVRTILRAPRRRAEVAPRLPVPPLSHRHVPVIRQAHSDVAVRPLALLLDEGQHLLPLGGPLGVEVPHALRLVPEAVLLDRPTAQEGGPEGRQLRLGAVTLRVGEGAHVLPVERELTIVRATFCLDHAPVRNATQMLVPGEHLAPTRHGILVRFAHVVFEQSRVVERPHHLGSVGVRFALGVEVAKQVVSETRSKVVSNDGNPPLRLPIAYRLARAVVHVRLEEVLQVKAGGVNPDERNLLSVAFKNLISSKRAACRTISAIEQNPKYAKFNGALLEYKTRIETQLQADCQKIIDMITNRVLNGECADEAKAFFIKMVGDYYRYIAENAKDATLEDVKQKAKVAYEQANAIDLPACNPIKLGLALNFSVFNYEVLKDHAKACDLADGALQMALDKIDELEEDDFRDAKSIIELLKENLTLWKEEEEGDNQIDDL